jgi:uncharacterized protein
MSYSPIINIIALQMKEFYKLINPKTILTLAIVAIVIAIVVSSFSSSEPEPDEYIGILNDFRKEKNDFFRFSEESPIEDKKRFLGLNYFEPNLAFKIKAHLELIKDTNTISVLRSDGKKEDFKKYAYAHFAIEDTMHRVMLLKRTANRVDTNLRFMPFYDKTNGTETYPGGRYLDLRVENHQTIMIDFNMAYNPYCTYNYRYSCPIPPEDNHINTYIRAGEKNYKQYDD